MIGVARGDVVKRMKTKKGRGGQRGNANALKHGLYSKHFSNAESKLLDELKKSPDDLESEIAMARVLALRVFGNLPASPSVEQLEALSVANTRLATLLRTAKFLRGEGDDVGLALAQALAELTNGK